MLMHACVPMYRHIYGVHACSYSMCLKHLSDSVILNWYSNSIN